MHVELENIIQWSTGKSVYTKHGQRILKTGEATKIFWDLWNSKKEDLKAAGISLTKEELTGKWLVNWWMPLPEEEVNKINANIEASKAVESSLEIPCPDGLEYMPFQKAGIEFLLNKDNALLSDSMGLGKTIQAIGVINFSKEINNILIICPNSLKLTWKHELERWLTRKDLSIQVYTSKDKEINTNIAILNYDIVAKFETLVKNKVWDLLILDEAHYLKNYKAKRTEAILGTGKKDSSPIRAKKKIFITGTPILNRPIELFSILRSIDPTGLGKSWYKYVDRYCGGGDTGFGRGIDTRGASNLEELQTRLRQGCMLRRLKEDVLKELPAKRRQIIEFSSEGLQDLLAKEKLSIGSFEEKLAELKYNITVAKLTEDRETYKQAVKELKDTNSLLFTEISEIRHETAIAKIPFVIDHLRDCLEYGPVVCFVHHKDVALAIHKEFLSNSVIITGDTKIEDRQKAIESFQSGKVDLFIGTIKAAGIGITLTKSSHAVFVEQDWTPSNITQAEDRLHRISQKNQVLIQHLVLENSIDSYIAKTLVRKQEIIEKILDETTKFENDTVLPIRGLEFDIDVKEEPIISEDEIENVHTALKYMAARCDGAVTEDGAGFNKFDSSFGKKLANKLKITKQEATVAKKLLKKYSKQLPESLYKFLYPIE